VTLGNKKNVKIKVEANEEKNEDEDNEKSINSKVNENEQIAFDVPVKIEPQCWKKTEESSI